VSRGTRPDFRSCGDEAIKIINVAEHRRAGGDIDVAGDHALAGFHMSAVQKKARGENCLPPKGTGNRDLSRVPPPNRLDPRRAPSFVTGYLDYKLNKRLKLEAYYLKGLTVQSPDRGAGISLALDF
jgi:hypothetical protein